MSANRRVPSDEPEALAARQQEHRLKERVRPKVLPPPSADPWLLAAEALSLLDSLRPHHRGHALDAVDEVAELVRRLCWGPSAP